MLSTQYHTQYQVELFHWWYVVRRQIVINLLKKYSTKKIRILDIGCGAGALMKELAQFGVIEGVDLSTEAIFYCKKRGIEQVSVGDICELPFVANSFDLVLGLDVLEHVLDDSIAIKEISRVLRNQGLVIVFAPAFHFLWGRADELGQHYRRYTKLELVSKLQEQGFEVLRSSYFNTFLFLPIFVIRTIVRLLKIKVETELNTFGGVIANQILLWIFAGEAFLLRFVNFPFGVSILVVARKK
jgi:SAM-dependent methyltransferase